MRTLNRNKTHHSKPLIKGQVSLTLYFSTPCPDCSMSLSCEVGTDKIKTEHQVTCSYCKSVFEYKLKRVEKGCSMPLNIFIAANNPYCETPN